MYDIRLNKKSLDENNITLAESIALIAIEYSLNLEQALNSLREKGLVDLKYFELQQSNNYFISNNGTKLLKSIILTGESRETGVKASNIKLEILANRLINLYPKGLKPNTNAHWRGSSRDIQDRLKSFFKIYGNTYTDEEILEATRIYVNSYQNDMKFMQVLYYFIWKEKGHQEGGTIARNSELAARLENKTEETVSMKEDWTSSLK